MASDGSGGAHDAAHGGARGGAPFGLADASGPMESPALPSSRMSALSANSVRTIVFRSVLVSV